MNEFANYPNGKFRRSVNAENIAEFIKENFGLWETELFKRWQAKHNKTMRREYFHRDIMGAVKRGLLNCYNSHSPIYGKIRAVFFFNKQMGK